MASFEAQYCALKHEQKSTAGEEPEAGLSAAAAIYRGIDRRAEPTPRFSRFTFGKGRRKAIRRTSEREGTFVDRYSLRLWLMAVWVCLMNVGDSYFTLVHLQAGGIELNPIADRLLETGRWGFVLYKSSLIGVAVLVLCIHKNFFLARFGLWVATATYTVLVLYHLSLFE
ncbi:MAG: hypothetical protein ACI8TQ_000121 [Planctomycetota bacterium]